MVALVGAVGGLGGATRAGRTLQITSRRGSCGTAGGSAGDGDGGTTETGAIEGFQSGKKDLLILVLNNTLTLLVHVSVADITNTAEVVLEISPVGAARNTVHNHSKIGAVRRGMARASTTTGTRISGAVIVARAIVTSTRFAVVATVFIAVGFAILITTTTTTTTTFFIGRAIIASRGAITTAVFVAATATTAIFIAAASAVVITIVGRAVSSTTVIVIVAATTLLTVFAGRLWLGPINSHVLASKVGSIQITTNHFGSVGIVVFLEVDKKAERRHRKQPQRK